MLIRKHVYTPPSWAILRWLTEAGPGIPREVRDVMRRELFSSPRAVLLAVCNGLLINASALLLLHGAAFLCFMAIDIALAALRLLVLRRAARSARRGMPTPTDLYLVTAMLWCALQGIMAFVAMRTGNHLLQVLFATTVMGLLGPICARTYPAPRLALLFVSLCVVPFVTGAALSGERWLLLLVVQTPIYLLGSLIVIRRFHNMAVAALRAQHDSQDRARHDPLTGVLNRFGLTELLSRHDGFALQPYVLFYLDLDGFKQVNDRFGHQAGDSLLQSVAARLQAGTRVQDAVSRIGGDEFVVLAHGMTPAEAEVFADSIIGRVTQQPYVLGTTEPLRIGISIGFACSPEDGTSLEDLQRKADAALYDAKMAGKGRSRRFDWYSSRRPDLRSMPQAWS